MENKKDAWHRIPRQESNPYHGIRNPVFYPLNYEGSKAFALYSQFQKCFSRNFWLKLIDDNLNAEGWSYKGNWSNYFETLLCFEVSQDIIRLMKRCTSCKKRKLISDFNFKIKALGLRHYQCKDCTRLFVKNHYNKNKGYYLEKTRKRNKELRLEILKYIRQYLLRNPCVDCGESDITVLEFDHKGEVPKFKAVSSLARSRYPLAKIKEEINKCEVRCANCHRRKTAKEFRWFKNNNALVA